MGDSGSIRERGVKRVRRSVANLGSSGCAGMRSTGEGGRDVVRVGEPWLWKAPSRLWPLRIEESLRLTPGPETQSPAVSLRLTRGGRGSLTRSWARRELEDWTLGVLLRITPP